MQTEKETVPRGRSYFSHHFSTALRALESWRKWSLIKARASGRLLRNYSTTKSHSNSNNKKHVHIDSLNMKCLRVHRQIIKNKKRKRVNKAKKIELWKRIIKKFKYCTKIIYLQKNLFEKHGCECE